MCSIAIITLNLRHSARTKLFNVKLSRSWEEWKIWKMSTLPSIQFCINFSTVFSLLHFFFVRGATQLQADYKAHQRTSRCVIVLLHHAGTKHHHTDLMDEKGLFLVSPSIAAPCRAVPPMLVYIIFYYFIAEEPQVTVNNDVHFDVAVENAAAVMSREI